MFPLPISRVIGQKIHQSHHMSIVSVSVPLCFSTTVGGKPCVGIVRLTFEDVIRLPIMHTPLMRTSVSFYHHHRFPAEIISHSVWLYFRFALSFRDVEEMLAMRGGLLAMRRFENGVLSSVRPSLTPYAADLLDQAIDGTWMRYS